jgi:hypothetical protein
MAAGGNFPTPIGANSVTAIARRFILPYVADNVYLSNVIFFRLNKANKRMVQGGFQIEAPLMWQDLAAGGPYTGYDVLDVTPSDPEQNGAWNWRQYYIPVTVDGLTLIKTDQPEAIANFLRLYFAQAEMKMADLLGDGLFSDAVTNTKKIDGLLGAVDDPTTTNDGPNSYAGINRNTGNSWWRAQTDTTTYTTAGTKFSLTAFQTIFGNCSSGGRHPTIIVSTQGFYNIYWNLNTAGQTFPVQPSGHDEVLAQSGFTNLLFNGVPVVVDSHVPAAATGGTKSNSGRVFLLNEDYIHFCVSPRGDFYMDPFQEPVNQDAMTAKILWAGNLVLNNCARQGKIADVQG